MSAHHDAHVLTRERSHATDRPIGRGVKLLRPSSPFSAPSYSGGRHSGRERAWQALHVNWLFFVSVSQAAIAFVAVQRITTARWSRPVVRFLEGMSRFSGGVPAPGADLPRTAPHLPVDARGPPGRGEGAVVRSGVPHRARSGGFRHSRAVERVVRLHLRSPRRGPFAGGWRTVGAWPPRSHAPRVWRRAPRDSHHAFAAGWLAGPLSRFGFFMSLLSWDLSMTLDMHFFSTLYGWWSFMNGWLGALMAFALICLAWRRHLGRYDLITETHFHDIGKLCFAFTAFWGYLTFGQYLVIWYGNMGEETHWARLRLIAPWLKVTLPVASDVPCCPLWLLSAQRMYTSPRRVLRALQFVGLWLLRSSSVPSLP